jgi:hypothetical protein
MYLLKLVFLLLTHLAYFFSFRYYSIYTNEIESTPIGFQTTFASFSLENVVRTSNFIGRGNWFQSDQDKLSQFIKKSLVIS